MTITADPTYAELLAEYLPSMPTNEEENQRLIQILETLSKAGRDLGEAEKRFYETVIALVLQYEDKAYPMRVVPALEMLHGIVAERGLRQADFVAEFGSRAYVNQIFKGTRPITKGVAAKLARVLNVSTETLLPSK
jgi:antitoxin component HigA of HigAB toxin-antitoxin module